MTVAGVKGCVGAKGGQGCAGGVKGRGGCGNPCSPCACSFILQHNATAPSDDDTIVGCSSASLWSNAWPSGGTHLIENRFQSASIAIDSTHGNKWKLTIGNTGTPLEYWTDDVIDCPDVDTVFWNAGRTDSYTITQRDVNFNWIYWGPVLGGPGVSVFHISGAVKMTTYASTKCVRLIACEDGSRVWVKLGAGGSADLWINGVQTNFEQGHQYLSFAGTPWGSVVVNKCDVIELCKGGVYNDSYYAIEAVGHGNYGPYQYFCKCNCNTAPPCPPCWSGNPALPASVMLTTTGFSVGNVTSSVAPNVAGVYQATDDPMFPFSGTYSWAISCESNRWVARLSGLVDGFPEVIAEFEITTMTWTGCTPIGTWAYVSGESGAVTTA